MKLKKIELSGFKSFADRTTLKFSPGITAVVGPNGCGKSNIADAFRWVLGEQSAKSMRGSKMHDVIFSGTSSRRPLNLCEVTITLEEAAGHLLTEYQELAITRRLYRDGESDYLINRQSVRLKDISDLLLDSGIGKDSFAIFEQGKLDQVIQLAPLERRSIFEEAAGILRFLQRKRESLMRLQQTEANLDRVLDIYREVDRQILVLERQAGEAQIYKEKKARLELLERIVCAFRWEVLEKKRAQLGVKRETQQKKLEEFQRTLARMEVERQEANFSIAHTQKEFLGSQQAIFEARSALEISKKDWEVAQARQREALHKEERWQKELSLLQDKKIERSREEAQARLEQITVDERLSQEEARVKEQQHIADQFERQLTVLREARETVRSSLLSILREENLVKTEIKELALRIDLAQERNKQSHSRLKALEQTLLENEKSISAHQRSAETAQQKLERLRFQAQALDQESQKTAAEREEVFAHFHKVEQQLFEQRARFRVLHKLREEMEGLSSATKILLKEAQTKDSPLHGKLRPLYELLVESPEFALCFGVASLRPYTQTLVVKESDDLSLVLAFCQEKKLKDFSLFSVPESCSSPLLEYFLKGITPFSNCSDIFTDLRGVLFCPAEVDGNVFSREAELHALNKTSIQLETQKDSLEREAKVISGSCTEIEKQKKALLQEIRLSEIHLAEQQFSLRKLQDEKNKAQNDLNAMIQEIQILDQKIMEMQTRFTHSDQRRIVAEERTRQAQQEIEKNDMETAESLAACKTAASLLTQIRNSYQKSIDEKKKIEHFLNLCEVRDLESINTQKRLEEEIALLRAQQTEINKHHGAFVIQIEEAARALERRIEASRHTEAILHEKKQAYTRLEEQLSEQKKLAGSEENALHEFSLQEMQLQAAQESIINELSERLNTSLEEALEKRQGITEAPEKIEKSLRTLRLEVESSSAINLAAIEEHAQQRERHLFLSRQIEDLTLAKTELFSIITHLDEESRKVFHGTFEKIRTNFKKNFEILFQGGEADLTFTEHADILEAGIEIIAKPPGKQMRSISLLSGGEKCLTAIALLFAIFEVKPAPFCILDEIDAPLDDTNVERFVNVVKQFVDRCQFIIVTHNKHTMAIADRIYGVSMQEKGVSKLLSIEFSQEQEPEPSIV